MRPVQRQGGSPDDATAVIAESGAVESAAAQNAAADIVSGGGAAAESAAADNTKVERAVVVGSAEGLHARPAAVLVKAAAELPVKVMIRKGDGTPVPARSIMRLIGIDANFGDEVVVSAEGEGAAEAVDLIADLVSQELDDGEEDEL